MNQLRESLSHFWNKVYGFLFPILEEELGELTAKQQQLISILEIIRIEDFVKPFFGAGRPPEDRKAIVRAFVAKAVYNMTTTRELIERLTSDGNLRRICGWVYSKEVPEEWSFSRAFAEFASSSLPAKVHEILIKSKYADQIVGHISRDATEIEAREKPQKSDSQASSPEAKLPVGRPGKEEQRHLPEPTRLGRQGKITFEEVEADLPRACEKPQKSEKEETVPKTKYPRGRPKKDELRPLPEPTRLERQQGMTLEEMLADLPKGCNVGCKKNSKGFKETWVGYKLHLDAADGQIPICCILTSASLHDSQASFPLAMMSDDRVTNLYDLMDSAYDAEPIWNFSRTLNHVPIIDSNPRRGEKIEFEPPTKERYKERTTVERVFSRLKDEFGGRMVRVRGNAKVFAHLMFGVLALTADQLMKFLT